MADEPVRIFGKSSCPYTTAARNAYATKGVEIDYVDVVAHPDRMPEMLKLSNGHRAVPVIVDGGTVTIGFGGT